MVYDLLAAAVLNLKLSVNEFWDMPLFTLTELFLKNNNATRTGGMTRKELLTLERDARERYGWE